MRKSIKPESKLRRACAMGGAQGEWASVAPPWKFPATVDTARQLFFLSATARLLSEPAEATPQTRLLKSQTRAGGGEFSNQPPTTTKTIAPSNRPV